MDKQQILASSFFIGGVYDILLGIALIILRTILLEFFGHEIPNNNIFPDILGLFLIAVGYLLVYSSRSPEHFIFIGIASVSIRLIYSMYILYLLVSNINVELLYILFGISDFLTAIFILYAIIITKNLKIKNMW